MTPYHPTTHTPYYPQTAPLQGMPAGDLRKSLFLSAKVLNLTRALDTYEVGAFGGV